MYEASYKPPPILFLSPFCFLRRLGPLVLLSHKQWSFYPRNSALQWCGLGPSLHRTMQSQMNLSHFILGQWNLICCISEVINHSTIYNLPNIHLHILICATTKFTRMSLPCLIDTIPISTKNLRWGIQIRYSSSFWKTVNKNVSYPLVSSPLFFLFPHS